ncbi:copine-9-like [Xenia sp. Carnegie-2017]|uniref:copine-9-like n=1 Tax=Xenia sp. Carnegie-2017 TaxID=2897299 RepID=UPI001F03D920|nr:copine-9-like [Xenia sp. Carnegie-2017]XP_046841251.1 copine-9-like [Xenia sp. Carnegie-2017]
MAVHYPTAPPTYSEVVEDPSSSIHIQNAVPATQVEISVKCKNLADMDLFSKSDPVVVLFVKSVDGREWREFGRTEVIMNTLNPVFVKKFIMNYFFEEIQELRFHVYDVDSNSPRLSDHDFIGRLDITLGSIIGEHGGRLEAKLENKETSKCGSIILTVEEVSECKDVATLHFKANKLDKKDFLGKSDPFLVFYRCNEDSSFTAVHRTEVIKNTLNPMWKPFSVPGRALCNGDYDRSILVECYDWDRDGGHDFIGHFSTTLREMNNSQLRGITWEVVNTKKQRKKKKYRNSGTVTLLQCKVEQQPTFLDFIRGGTQLSFVVAVDFTASNGEQNNPNSLHYINPYEPNLYVKALSAVGRICEDYDSDKYFPAFGFGARLPPHWQVSHEFALNWNPENPYCSGVSGVVSSYRDCIQKVKLYGPTNFAPVINSCSRIARDSIRRNHGSEYFVLLILTDGIISDMAQTKEAIVNAASLPMSIIIVGIGPADFEAMEVLDGDVVRLSSRGREAERDIVQFVPFRNYLSSRYGDVTSGARLASDVLEELPGQFLEYMKKHKIQPRQP